MTSAFQNFLNEPRHKPNKTMVKRVVTSARCLDR